MSDKEKRQKRFQQKTRHMDRQVSIWNNVMGSTYQQPLHKFHKIHALNCGDPNCIMCGNPRKFFGKKTLAEKRFECEPID